LANSMDDFVPGHNLNQPRQSCRGFTLLELLVVVAVIGIVSSLLLPALSKAKFRAQGIYCLNNLKQLSLGWKIYTDDHIGELAFNMGGAASRTNLNWVNNILDWELSPDNTNTLGITEAAMGYCVSKTPAIYRCPSDNVLSRVQQSAGWKNRVRSYSMNAMVGNAGPITQGGVNTNNSGYVQFFKESSIPAPSQIFVFIEEHPDSISDGYFLNRAYRQEWNDLPASYHDGAGTFAFADGHTEMHRWRYSTTKPPSIPGGADLPIAISANSLADYDWVKGQMSILRH
jgi:prepilin-type N-terminal cleavage/methylation domain-containing protein/prepilin-type processing-associated H-X9-DG protein